MDDADFEAEVRSRALAFVAELTVAMHGVTLEIVRAKLEGKASPATPPAANVARSSRSRSPAQRSPAPASSRTRPATQTPEHLHDPSEIGGLTDKLANYIREHPGSFMAALSVALGVPSSALRWPLRKLMAAQKIRSEGKKAGTRYFPVPTNSLTIASSHSVGDRGAR
jgi:hypothetical protein